MTLVGFYNVDVVLFLEDDARLVWSEISIASLGQSWLNDVNQSMVKGSLKG